MVLLKARYVINRASTSTACVAKPQAKERECKLTQIKISITKSQITNKAEGSKIKGEREKQSH